MKPYRRIEPEDWLMKDHPYVSAQARRAMENPEAELEEYVRQWVLAELVETYHYPKEWLGQRIQIEYGVMVNTTTTNYADVAILNDRGKPYLFIECKRLREPLVGPERAVEQLQASLSVTYTTTVGMATNGHDTLCFLKQIDPKEFAPHFDIPEYRLRESPSHAQPSKLAKPVQVGPGPRKTGLEEMDYRTFSRALFECHSIMRDHQGLHADQALDEMCKLVYTKIFDELTTPISGDFRFQTWIYSSTEELASSIRTLYSETRERELIEMDQRIRGYAASRGVFRDEIKLSDAVIEMIVEQLQKFSVVDTKIDIRGKAFEQFLKGKIRQSMGQYFTPEPVIRLLVGIADPKPDDLIIDPACGSARMLTHCLDHAREEYIIPQYGEDSDVDKNFREKRLHGIEISPQLCRLAMTDMMMHGDGRSNVRCTDGLAPWENYADVQRGVFTLCLTNPPFGSKIKDEAVLRRFKLGLKKKGQGLRKQQKKEVLFLERCMDFLAPGGRLAIVVPEGILENSNDADIRTWYRDVARLVAVVKLPPHTFMPFGANVETSLLFLRKWKDGEAKTTDHKVFHASLQDVTYDTIGNDCRCGTCTAHRQDPDVNADEIDRLIEYFHEVATW